MWPEVPKTDEEMQKLKQAIYSNEAYYGSYVSLDSKKSLIYADFFEDAALDYSRITNELERLRAKVEDANTTLSIVGHPMHLGVVANMIDTMNYIMGATADYNPHPAVHGLPVVLGNPDSTPGSSGFRHLGARLHGHNGLQP